MSAVRTPPALSWLLKHCVPATQARPFSRRPTAFLTPPVHPTLPSLPPQTFDATWDSAALSNAVCDELVSQGKIRATPAFIRGDRQTKITKVRSSTHAGGQYHQGLRALVETRLPEIPEIF